MRITTIHINALGSMFLLGLIIAGTLTAEAIRPGTVGCSLGEIIMICVVGIVWCAKAFAGQGGAGNGDAE